MALDPRISLAIQAPSVAPAINIFENALMNAQSRDLRQQQAAQQALLNPLQVQQAQQNVDINQQTLNQNRDTQRLQSLNRTGQRLKPFLVAGDIDGAQQFMTQNLLDIQARQDAGEDIDDRETVETITNLRSGNIQRVFDDINQVEQLASGGKGQRQFAPQQSAPITDPITGQVSTPVFDPNTQTTSLVPIEGAFQETPTQKSEREFGTAEKISDLSIAETKQKETIKKTVARTSELKTQFSTQRRLAANSLVKIREAQKLSEKATQGLAGASKVQLGRVFPGIDTSNEAALTGAFKSLALDELQKFKGPTTDFEFRVTEDIAGSLGDGASANKARLASLERASWFAGKEARQFNEHIKAGHDPDEFNFNFAELVTPKKGGKSYSLKSLQDTAVANHISIDEVIKRLSR